MTPSHAFTSAARGLKLSIHEIKNAFETQRGVSFVVLGFEPWSITTRRIASVFQLHRSTKN